MIKYYKLIAVGLALLLSGCISPKLPTLPQSPPPQSKVDTWWMEFGDEKLNLLVHDALKESLTLQAAKQRVLQSYALLQNKNAGDFPTLSLSGSTNLQDELKGKESKKETYTATLSASYEIDIFSKRDDAINSQKATFFATHEALHVSSISLVADLATAWFTLGYKQESLALLEEQLQIAFKILELTKFKHQSGKNSITDIWQQEQYIKNLEAQKIILLGDIETQKRAINILLGRSPLEEIPFAKEAKLITLPPSPEVGIFATKLLVRPDVKQAFYNLQASSFDLSEAIKNQYPSLNLSLSAIGTSTQFSTLLDTIIGSAMASLSGTLFDAGAKEALVKKALFISNERSLLYKQTLLQAFNDVQNAQANEITQTLYMYHLNERVALANAIFDRQQTKYLYGVIEYLNVLNAQQSLQELEQTRLSKHLELIKYRIALYRSLGGGLIEYDIEKEFNVN